MRKPLSKRIRFEVLKRDNFQCHYCGAKAPDVKLHVDHIKPVAEGGTDDFLNLVTSCEPCNLGKGARPLDEQQELAKQVAEISKFERRKEDLDRLRERKAQADEVLSLEAEAVSERLEESTGFGLSDAGLKTVRKWLRVDNIETVITAVDGAVETYWKEWSTGRDFEKMFAKVPAVIQHRKNYGAKSDAYRKMKYAAAVMRNRVERDNFINWEEDAFEDAYTHLFEVMEPHECDAIADVIVDYSKTEEDYYEIEQGIYYLIERFENREEPS